MAISKSHYLVDASGRPYFSSGIVLPWTSGVGIRGGDDSSSDWGWNDIIGHVNPKVSGAGSPARAVWNGDIYDYAFAVNDQIDFSFHISHEHVTNAAAVAAGTTSDLYFHVHWSHTGTTISGDFVWQIYATYAKGHNQANFPAQVAPTITYSTVDIATTPALRHCIDEIQLSAGSPSATQLDSDDIEPDGLIIITCKPTTVPTLGGGGKLFVHFTDLHHKVTYGGTKNKAPNFYA
jgi:hypothetical protein